MIKNAKEQLRALPDGLTYGLLRYLNGDVDLAGADPTIGFNYLGRLGAGVAELSEDMWRISRDGLSVTDAAAAVPMPLMHTVELNAGTVDTDTGPQLHANWTWAPSALDHAQINRLSQLWFDALTGICAHVRTRRRRTDPVRYRPRPAQPAADRRTATAIPDRRHPAPDTDAAGVCSSTAEHRQPRAHDDLYAVQLDITVTGPLDPHRLRDAVQTVVDRHPNLAARFREQFDEPVQIIPADPARPGGTSTSAATTQSHR